MYNILTYISTFIAIANYFRCINQNVDPLAFRAHSTLANRSKLEPGVVRVRVTCG